MSKRKRPQFRLLTLFLLTTVVAYGLALAFTFADWLSGLCTAALFLVLPAIATTIVVHCRGYMRTFCTGALFPMVSGLYAGNDSLWSLMTSVQRPAWGTAYHYRSLRDLQTLLIASLGASLLTGLICMGVRRLVEERETGQESAEADTANT